MYGVLQTAGVAAVEGAGKRDDGRQAFVTFVLLHSGQGQGNRWAGVTELLYGMVVNGDGDGDGECTSQKILT